MAWIAPAVSGAGIVANALTRPRRPDISGSVARLRSANPVGSSMLTPADYRASEMTRGRLASAARAQGTLAGYDVSRRSRARGLAGSPSEERDLARVQQQTALGAENAGNSAEEQLYNVGMSRENFGRQKELAIFGAETNQAANDAARQDAQQAEYWNSLNGLVSTAQSYLPRPGVAAAAPTAVAPAPQAPVYPGSARGYNPSLERPSKF